MAFSNGNQPKTVTQIFIINLSILNEPSINFKSYRGYEIITSFIVINKLSTQSHTLVKLTQMS